MPPPSPDLISVDLGVTPLDNQTGAALQNSSLAINASSTKTQAHEPQSSGRQSPRPTLAIKPIERKALITDCMFPDSSVTSFVTALSPPIIDYQNSVMEVSSEDIPSHMSEEALPPSSTLPGDKHPLHSGHSLHVQVLRAAHNLSLLVEAEKMNGKCL